MSERICAPPAKAHRHDSAESMGPDTLPMRGQPGDNEMTGIVSRGSGQSYRALQTSGAARPRRSQTLSKDHQPPPPPGSRGTAGPDDPDCGAPWWTRPLGKLRSLELENKGSVARDHLALERTFLAWLRTSLAFASIGIAVTQLFRLPTSLPDQRGDLDTDALRRMGKMLGAAFLSISILTLLLGFRRYFHGQEWVVKGKFPASRGSVVAIALVALAITLVSLVVVIVIHPAEK